MIHENGTTVYSCTLDLLYCVFIFFIVDRMVDCSHGNSNKNHDNQKLVLFDIVRQILGIYDMWLFMNRLSVVTKRLQQDGRSFLMRCVLSPVNDRITMTSFV